MIRGEFSSTFAGETSVGTVIATIQGLREGEFWNLALIRGTRDGAWRGIKLDKEWLTYKDSRRGQSASGIRITNPQTFRHAVEAHLKRLEDLLDAEPEVVHTFTVGHTLLSLERVGNVLSLCGPKGSVAIVGPYVHEHPHDNSYTFWGPYYHHFYVWTKDLRGFTCTKEFSFTQESDEGGQTWDIAEFYAELQKWIEDSDSFAPIRLILGVK